MQAFWRGYQTRKELQQVRRTFLLELDEDEVDSLDEDLKNKLTILTFKNIPKTHKTSIKNTNNLTVNFGGRVNIDDTSEISSGTEELQKADVIKAQVHKLVTELFWTQQVIKERKKVNDCMLLLLHYKLFILFMNFHPQNSSGLMPL